MKLRVYNKRGHPPTTQQMNPHHMQFTPTPKRKKTSFEDICHYANDTTARKRGSKSKLLQNLRNVVKNGRTVEFLIIYFEVHRQYYCKCPWSSAPRDAFWFSPRLLKNTTLHPVSWRIAPPTTYQDKLQLFLHTKSPYMPSTEWIMGRKCI